jgi:predicted NUDIX family NTP pyrophosphohydrolase
MPRRSAGILAWKRDVTSVSLLLVHFGGPYWANKDVWSIPKGEYEADEDPLAAARREFQEELGRDLSDADNAAFVSLGSLRQAGGKVVTAYAFESDFDVSTLSSNTFEMEWPPKSGRRKSFPEVDRAAWFSIEDARARMLPSQRTFIDRLLAMTATPRG